MACRSQNAACIAAPCCSLLSGCCSGIQRGADGASTLGNRRSVSAVAATSRQEQARQQDGAAKSSGQTSASTEQLLTFQPATASVKLQALNDRLYKAVAVSLQVCHAAMAVWQPLQMSRLNPHVLQVANCMTMPSVYCNTHTFKRDGVSRGPSTP